MTANKTDTMKKVAITLSSLLIALIFGALSAQADSLESVRVIKWDEDNHDLIIERSGGERLLIQHNRICHSFSTEFPVKLLRSGGVITQLKVDVNEICQVYNAVPYNDEIKITERIRPTNLLEKEHEARIEWKGRIYNIEYGPGCTYLREFVGKEAYLHSTNAEPKGGTITLPKHRGQCRITASNPVGTVTQDEVIASPIDNLKVKAENQQAFFTWDKPESGPWLYLISHSKFQIDPADYNWREMPNLRNSRFNFYRQIRLINDQDYYFYLSARDQNGNIAPWQEVQVTPVKTNRRFINRPDPEVFEISMTVQEDNFLLNWPDKADDSKKVIIQLWVDGELKEFAFKEAETHTLTVNRYEGAERYKLSVRTVPLSPYGVRHHDSIYWEAN
jgi:hypothetical protein